MSIAAGNGTPVDKTQERLDKAATWLAGSFTTVTALLAGLGAVNGGLERMLRNHAVLSSIAFGLVALAIALAVMALSSFAGSQIQTQRRLILFSSIAFAVGLLFTTLTAVVTPSAKERPSIAASFKSEGGLVLEATVKAGGIKAREHVVVVVDGLSDERTRPDDPDIVRLYISQLGPSTSGSVEHSLRVPFSPGRFDRIAITAGLNKEERVKCRQQNFLEGCLIMRPPPGSERPLLTATWEGQTPSSQMLALNVNAQDLRVDKSVLVRVVGRADGSDDESLFSSLLAPDAMGKLESLVKIPIPSHLNNVCIASVTVTPSQASEVTPECPPRANPSTVWAELGIPKAPVRLQ